MHSAPNGVQHNLGVQDIMTVFRIVLLLRSIVKVVLKSIEKALAKNGTEIIAERH